MDPNEWDCWIKGYMLFLILICAKKLCFKKKIVHISIYSPLKILFLASPGFNMYANELPSRRQKQTVILLFCPLSLLLGLLGRGIQGHPGQRLVSSLWV